MLQERLVVWAEVLSPRVKRAASRKLKEGTGTELVHQILAAKGSANLGADTADLGKNLTNAFLNGSLVLILKFLL